MFGKEKPTSREQSKEEKRITGGGGTNTWALPQSEPIGSFEGGDRERTPKPREGDAVSQS